jgi:hypothetical protein
VGSLRRASWHSQLFGALRSVNLLGALVALTALTSLAEEERPALVILDVVSKGASETEASAISTALVRGARELEAFQVFSSEDARQFLAIERQKQLLGSSEPSSLEMIQSGLGAQNVVAASLTHAGTYQLEVRLLDTHTGKVLAQQSLPPAANFPSLVPAVPALAQQLLGHLLQMEVGHLLVRTSEEGCEVLIDGQLKGSTPLPSPIAVPRGKHRVTVKKSGFVERTGIVRVGRGELAVENITLAPSAEFAKLHADKNGKMRVGAWITSAVAVAALGAAISIDRLVTEPTYQSQFLPRSRVLALESRDPDAVSTSVTQSAAETACANDTVACRDQTKQLATQIQGQQYLAVGLAAGGLLSAGFATYFWIAGEDPGRYRQLIIGGGPTPGGAMVNLGARF